MNIYDISEKAGVSIATVSRVLNNSPHVSEATRRRVLRVIEQNGYVPNAFARGLGLGSMKTIGLLCPDAADPYQSEALSRLEAAFRARRYDCLLTCTGSEVQDRVAGMEALRSRRVDGMVLMGSSFIEPTEEGNGYLREVAEEIPMVLLNGCYHAPGVYCVLCDDEQATREATEALARMGRRRILYLCHSRNASGLSKLRGYRTGLQNAGLPVEEGLIRLMGEDVRDVAAIRRRLLDWAQNGLLFDAVMTSDDRLAAGALKYARSRGLRVPEDLAVMGYNNSSLCMLCEPELSSVDIQLPAICDQVAQTMMGVLEGRAMPRETVYTASLCLRGTTG